jgi:hypothetical protein
MSPRVKRLGIVIRIVLALCLLAAAPGTAAPLKGLPVAVEVSSLEELSKALEKATPGSVIRLAAGLYQIYAEDPGFLIKNIQGLPDQPIVIQGAPVREDGKRATIIDGGRSLDPMLGLQEHYRRPGNRPIELHDLLIQKQFRTDSNGARDQLLRVRKCRLAGYRESDRPQLLAGFFRYLWE